MTENSTDKAPDKTESKLTKTEISKMKKRERNKRYYEKHKQETTESNTSEQTMLLGEEQKLYTSAEVQKLLQDQQAQNFFFAKNQTSQIQTSQSNQTQGLTTTLLITTIPILLPLAIRLAGGIYAQRQKSEQSKPSQESSPTPPIKSYLISQTNL